MSSDSWGYLLVSLPFMLAFAAFLAWHVRPYPEAKRRQEGERWARRHQAFVDARWVSEVDECLQRDRRVRAATGGILMAGVWLLVPTVSAVLVCLVSLPALLALVRGYYVTRADLVPPGARVARLRELSIEDYVPPAVRGLMWAAVGLGAASAMVAAVLTTWWVAVAAGLLLLGASAVELTGARLARMPEPAGDPSHLYWQDALRVDALLSAIGSTEAAAWMTCLTVSKLADLDLVWRLDFVLFLLFLPTLVVGLQVHDRPVARMRSRLWPTLEPGRVLMPGEPVPAQGA
jgi:hypothetical protein